MCLIDEVLRVWVWGLGLGFGGGEVYSKVSRKGFSSVLPLARLWRVAEKDVFKNSIAFLDATLPPFKAGKGGLEVVWGFASSLRRARRNDGFNMVLGELLLYD
jgi:hypothetical protein